MSTAPTVPNSQRRTVGSLRVAPLLKKLSNVINDRQPDSQKQTPETEWRRQRDLVASLNTMRDVLAEALRMMQDGTLSPLATKGQMLVSDGNADVPLDPPRGVAGQSVAVLTVQNGNLKWDPNFSAGSGDCCAGGINSLDYGLITDPPDHSLDGDYGLVADPPTSSYDFGFITDPP